MLHNPPHNPLFEGHAGEAQRALATQVFGKKSADSSSISTGVDIEQIRAFLPHPRPIPTPIMFGGTGETTALRAFNALSPTTTLGDMIYQAATNDARLAIGTNHQYLKSFDEGSGPIPKWVDLDASDMTVGTLPNARLDADLAAIGNLATTEGFYRKTGAGTVTVHKSNLAAAVAPTANDDSGDGYSIGSIWIDTVTDMSYTCVDATVAAAVWNGTMGGGMNALLDGSVHSDTLAQTPSLNAVVVGTGANLWSKVTGPATWGFLCGDNGTGGPIAFTNTLPNDQTIIFGSGDAKIYGDVVGDLRLSVQATGFTRMLYNDIEFFSFGKDTATGTKPAIILRDAAGAEYGSIALANTADMILTVTGSANKFFLKTGSTTQVTFEDNKVTFEAGASDIAINFATNATWGFDIGGSDRMRLTTSTLTLPTASNTPGWSYASATLSQTFAGSATATWASSRSLSFISSTLGGDEFDLSWPNEGTISLRFSSVVQINWQTTVQQFENTGTLSQKTAFKYDAASVLKFFVGDPFTSTNEALRFGADKLTWKPGLSDSFSITGTNGTAVLAFDTVGTVATLAKEKNLLLNNGTGDTLIDWANNDQIRFYTTSISAANEAFRFDCVGGTITFEPNNAASLVINGGTTNEGKFLMESTEILRLTTADATFFEECIFSANKGAQFNAGTGLTVDGAMWNDSTRKVIPTYINGVTHYPVSVLYTQTSAITIDSNDQTQGTDSVSVFTDADPTTPFTATVRVGTRTLPANYLVAGKVIRVRARGHYSTNGTNSFQHRLYLGSTLIGSQGSYQPASASGNYWELSFEIHCVAAGNPGSVWGQGFAAMGTGSGGNIPIHIDMGGNSVDGPNTTTSLEVGLKLRFTDSTASASLTVTGVTIESLG